MPIQTVERIIHQCPPNSTMGWQGGEPTLMGLDFYEHVVNLRPDINHTLMTNGTLLNAEWAKFLSANKFLVGISIDGPRQIHNIHRSDYDKTVAGLQHLLDHNVSVNAVVTVHNANWNRGVKIYRTLKRLGITYMQFIPILSNPLISEYSIMGYEWGVFLRSVFREWLKHDIDKIGVQLFDDCMLSITNRSPQCCAYNEQCGGFVVEADGNVYCCEHYIESSLLGNILEQTFEDMVDSPTFQIFSSDKPAKYCKHYECEFVSMCWGGCKKHRLSSGTDKNILCDGYRQLFQEFVREITPQC